MHIQCNLKLFTMEPTEGLIAEWEDIFIKRICTPSIFNMPIHVQNTDI